MAMDFILDYISRCFEYEVDHRVSTFALWYVAWLSHFALESMIGSEACKAIEALAKKKAERDWQGFKERSIT